MSDEHKHMPEGEHEHPAHYEHMELPAYDDYLKAQKITVKDIKDHLTGPIVSVIVHIIILCTLPSIVFMEHPKQIDSIEVQVENMEIKQMDKIPEPPKPPDEVLDDLEVEIDRPDVDTQVNVTVDSAASVSTTDVDINVDIPDLTSIKPNNSALKLPKIYAARATSGGRISAIKKYGSGTDAKKIEDAIEKALNWLANNQNEDGSWGVYETSKYSFTAMATLAFLAHGDTPASQKYGQVIVKALKKMLEWVDKKCNPYITSGWYSYDHSLIAYTIAEAYGITKMPKLKDAMEKTIRFIIENQNKRGTFYYGYDRTPVIQSYDRDPISGKLLKGRDPEPPSNLAFSGWNFQALKSAFSAGCELPGLQETIDKAILGIKYHENPNTKEGGFSETPRGKPDFGMTGVGILCLGLLGAGDSKEAKKAMTWMQKYNANGMKTCAWRYNADVHKEYQKAFTHALYTWYYQTQVIFQDSKGKGGTWNRWNRAFSNAYLQEQNSDGSWLTPAEKYGSHLDPNKTNAEWHYVKEYSDVKDLKIYATTQNCLTLEVYYRYLPTYRLSKSSEKKKSIVDEEEDLGLKIE
ncbi:MAG: hypothetical protein A2020_01055 [Lentisphaerae bacterium GWF2_45_14]|nr:MAG: hypothetical protein A2020_01055 [Lentisphaerae bacterium GWF2_45_14]